MCTCVVHCRTARTGHQLGDTDVVEEEGGHDENDGAYQDTEDTERKWTETGTATRGITLKTGTGRFTLTVRIALVSCDVQ